MNKFEQAIDNCPYSTYWYEMRNYMCHIVESYLQDSDCEWYHIYEKELDNGTLFRFTVFYIYNSLYVWTDTVIDGKIESSQLDKPVNDYIATVLYCNVENAHAAAPLLFKMIDNKKVKQIC